VILAPTRLGRRLRVLTAFATLALFPIGLPAFSSPVVDRTCDRAAFPSAQWTRCELHNFARTGQGPAEETAGPFLSRWQAQSTANIAAWTARAAGDPSWLNPTAGNTALLPLCATWGQQCTGDPYRYPAAPGPDGAAFYAHEAHVTPVVFYDRDCARLSGHVWVPRTRGTTSKLPTIVITNGSLQAPETSYWWAAQALVRAGYVVLTFDVRGQGRSDDLGPDAALGTNANSAVFWDGTVDAIDFLHSTPARRYPYSRTCAATYPTSTNAFNPAWNRIDPARLGLAAHSLGAIAISVVQGFGAPRAAPWPGLMDKRNPVKVVVGWDSLITPTGAGFAPVENEPLPPSLSVQLLQAETGIPAFGVRVPALSFNADYGLAPAPYLTPPDPELHKQVFATWSAAKVPTYSLTFQGTTHFDYSLLPTFPATSWCADTSTGACRGGWGRPAITYYTIAWFDRWLKNPSEPGYRDADARLFNDNGPQGAVKMSFRYRSARDFRDRAGHRQLCLDIRSGC
jgi:alpha-beta hydrolase superfamily lysophospholipase